MVVKNLEEYSHIEDLNKRLNTYANQVLVGTEKEKRLAKELIKLNVEKEVIRLSNCKLDRIPTKYHNIAPYAIKINTNELLANYKEAVNTVKIIFNYITTC